MPPAAENTGVRAVRIGGTLDTTEASIWQTLGHGRVLEALRTLLRKDWPGT